jgi:site-specific recombinase XerD
MDGSPIPGAQGRPKGARARKKRPAGLHVIERGGFWHIVGTLRLGRSPNRVRESTGFRAIAENWEAANSARFAKEAALRSEVVDGKRPSVAFSVAAYLYLNRSRERPLNPIDVSKLQELERHFKTRKLDQISDREWVQVVDRRQAGNKPQTRERYLALVVAFLRWCVAPGRQWIQKLPAFDRDPKSRKVRAVARRRVIELTPKLVQLMINQASPHLRAQLAVEHATGARVSSILYGCRLCDLELAPGRERLVLHNTKSGATVNATLTAFAVAALKDYLKWRGRLEDREGPLFLTHLKQPYKDNDKAGGGQNKTAWAGMRRRVIKVLMEAAERDAAAQIALGDTDEAERIIALAQAEADLVSRVTQHWLRHHMATSMFAAGADLRTVMEQGGWLDAASALIYAHDVPENRRRHVRAALDAGLEIATPADTAENTQVGKNR